MTKFVLSKAEICPNVNCYFHSNPIMSQSKSLLSILFDLCFEKEKNKDPKI